MDPERALVAPASSQLLDRSGIEMQRSLGSRVGRYLVTVVGGTTASVATMLVSPTLGILAMLATLFGPPLVFFGRRFVRFVRAGFAATGAFRLAKHAVATRLGETAEGQWVRVRGHVLPGPSFTSAGGKPQAVLAWYLGSLGGLSKRSNVGRRELHGVDFTLAAPGGEFVRVRVAGARYLGSPTVVPLAWFEERPLHVRVTDDSSGEVASIYREHVVAVGDEVEVLGFLRREIDAAETGFRGVRPTQVLGARPPWALLIRRP